MADNDRPRPGDRSPGTRDRPGRVKAARAERAVRRPPETRSRDEAEETET
ncbi:hypothetical protein LNKW23_18020 [Paralimibaculum aggregatum]|uniref:Uncharacterized protein n=1 Tax=Paralimibaculum aggregatum TaxID=3036245 RepID=A0ABQ6LPJ5_9RHOB|nr:hypothetical protein [Limibaculum sp. NKW23]GMG82589.1 hypothetical protein LNKW23_18020 [Limibaculum sp. NKW23]